METRLSPHFVWLFASLAVAAGIGISYLTAQHGWRLSVLVFFGLVGVMACLSTCLTRATAAQAIVPFTIASAGLGALHYVIFKSLATAPATGAPGLDRDELGAAAVIAALLVLTDALIASVGGALFGIRLRGARSTGDLLKRSI